MNDIGSIIRNAVDKAVPSLVLEKIKGLQSSLNQRIDYEVNNDIAQCPGRKYQAALNAHGAYIVDYQYDGGMEAKLTISIDNDLPEEAQDYLSSAIYQAKQYVLG